MHARADARGLLFLGFATLFLELILIRYLAGNIWNLGYFPNLVLTAVFIGMGLGFTFHQHVSDRLSVLLFHAAPFVLLALVGFVALAHPTVPGFDTWRGDMTGDLYFTSTPAGGVAQSYAFLACVVGIAALFALVSQRTAKLFTRFAPLTAYTLDIGGSIVGILGFMLMSWQSIPAWVWFIVLTASLLLAAPGRGWTRWLPIVPLAAIVMIARAQDTRLLADPAYTGTLEVHWSPYQKVEYVDAPDNPHRIYVNGVSHQNMNTAERIRGLFYQVIHNERRGAPGGAYRDVLVLGAGSGNDVAAALDNGATHVDAVEIDPAIARLGKEHHPAHPYDDPRVTLVIDDGRAFMTRATRRYDLVVFALTDSVVKVSSMSQLRLENYLFTVDSVRRAWSILADGGDVVFYNFYRQPWLRQKIEGMIAAGTGVAPSLIFEQGDFAVLRARKSGAADAALPNYGVDLPTDDWPFLYLEGRGIPSVYAAAMGGMAGLIALLMLVLHARTAAHRGDRCERLYVKLAFVLMGVAFLLLETKGVIQFSLLFGTTWLNSSLVFLAVLVMILAANVAARTLRWRRLWLVYALLVASALVTLVFPLARLLSVESVPLRAFLASVLTFSPLFFANLLFSVSFRDLPSAEHVFGWNLLGATLGGVAEYTSMVLGYNLLAVIVAVAYTGAFLLLLAARRASASP